MRHQLTRVVAGCLLVSVSAAVHADSLGGFFSDFHQARDRGAVSYLLDIDNDTLLLNRNDGFYTSGIRFAQTYALQSSDKVSTYGWRIGQDMYTPSDIKLRPEFVGPPDHPYAAWLYAGLFKSVERSDGARYLVGLDVGCLGPCAGGEWTQTNFHRLLSQPLPQGWRKQVRNEVGAVLYGELSPVRWTPATWFDVTPSVKGRFGNIFTDVGAGVIARAGRLGATPRAPALYAYLRTDARAVGYNATLQGGYFSSDNPHTVSPRRWTGDAEAGVAWRNGVYGASLALTRRSNEISGLPASRGAQNFLHLQFAYTPR